MNEKQLREAVVKTMQSWLGRKESDGTHRAIIDIYNAHKPLARGYRVKYTDAWCATCVSAAFIKNGLTDIAPTECGCDHMIAAYKRLGRWQESDGYRPQPGDVIMYDWQDTGAGDCKGDVEHVGIVASVTGSTIKVIEGNMSNAVGYRTLQVDGRYIRGYCLPDYASKAGSGATPTKPAKIDPAQGKATKYAKAWTVNTEALNLRAGASTSKPILQTLKQGEVVQCYGYYTQRGSTVWLYVVAPGGQDGFVSKKYLK